MPPIEERVPQADLRNQQPLVLDYTALIHPPAIPSVPASPDSLEAAASAMRTAAGEISEGGHSVEASWQGLQEHYKAPEAERLYSVMGPVATKGDAVGDDTAVVADALETFAEEARTSRQKLEGLRERAWTLYEKCKDKEHWHLNPVDFIENVILKTEVNRAWGTYQEAERSCAQSIAGVTGSGTDYVAAGHAGDGVNTFVYGIDPDDVPSYTLDPSLEGADRLWDLMGKSNDLTWHLVVHADLPWILDPARDGAMALWDGFGPTMLWDMGVSAVVAAGLWTEDRGWASSPSEVGNNFVDHKVDLVLSAAAITGLYGQQGFMNPFDDDSRDGELWWENIKDAWGPVLHEQFPWTELEERPAYAWTTGGANAAVALFTGPIGWSVKGATLASTFLRGDFLPDAGGGGRDGFDSPFTTAWADGPGGGSGFGLPSFVVNNLGDYSEITERIRGFFTETSGPANFHSPDTPRSEATETNSGFDSDRSPQNGGSENPEQNHFTSNGDESVGPGADYFHDSNDGSENSDDLHAGWAFPVRVDESISSDLLGEIRVSVDLLSQVHRFPDDMSEITFKRNELRPGASGEFVPIKRLIILDPSDEYVREDIVHEIGHAVDQAGDRTTRLGLGSMSARLSPAMRNFLEVVKNSPEFQEINSQPRSRYVEYLTSPQELFARSYSQWITGKTGDSMLREKLDINRSLPGFDRNRQWSDDNFRPIEEALEGVFREWGLL
ncbi:hypothetical protein SUDANB121_03834 [Nocardiopsis dassonvillei]|uniref:hypothetical protein n=1 Tax=Nocardiopsis dassonvillei TaxID=2014 RepID=UPI003F5707EF